MGHSQPIGPDGLLPRQLFEYEIRLERTLDLTHPNILAQLQIDPEELIAQDRRLPQSLGQAAHGLSLQAIHCYSATGVGQVIVVFPEHIGSGTLSPRLLALWETVDDVQQ